MSAQRILAGYRYLFCTLLIISSVQTFLTEGREHAPVALLAAVEILAVVLLAARRTQWRGEWMLLGVLTCAQIAAARESEWPVRFALYAAGAFLIVLLDGALRSAQPAH